MTSRGGGRFERTLSSVTICSDDKVHAHHYLEPMVFKADWTGQVKKWLQGQVQVGVEESRWQSLCRGAPVQWDGGWREASSCKGSHPPPSPIPRTYLGQQHINLCDSVPVQFRSIKQPHIVAPTVVFYGGCKSGSGPYRGAKQRRDRRMEWTNMGASLGKKSSLCCLVGDSIGSLGPP